ncbi:FkbM family methyltransferase [Desulfobacterales bacterium HSG17]|nr:FkbM family methyltransferase [Desulfobacterales bacterium HSG17]
MKDEIIEKLFAAIPEVKELLIPDSEPYNFFDTVIQAYCKDREQIQTIDFNPIRALKWPCISMGNLNSYDLFGLNVFMHYAYLYKNFGFYKTIFDVGGNVGLDSIILEKFGYTVFAFEPDPFLVEIFRENIERNGSKNISIINKALSNTAEKKDFVRVKGNLTASHIDGARGYYGDVDFFDVECVTFEELDIIPDIIKINIEGFEKELIPCIPEKYLEKCDFIISIHNEEARDAIFTNFFARGMMIYSQKIGWKKVKDIDDLPGLNKEGYIFASKKNKMKW